MRIFPVVFFLICHGSISAQGLTNLSGLDSGNVLVLKIDGVYGGNVLTNQLVEKFIYGGEIDSIMKAGLSESMDKENNIAAELNVSIGYISTKPFGNNQLNWYSELNYTRLERLDFSKDVFDLVFYGNQPFEGSTANLNMNYESIGFQKLTFGIAPSKNNWKIGLSLYKGSGYNHIETDNSTLTTGVGANSIDIGLSASAIFTDTTNTGFKAWNGTGVGIELNYHIGDGSASGLYVSVKDLGLIFWNNQTNHLKQDTAYNYVGFDIRDLLQSNLSLENLNDTLGLNSDKKFFASPLPFLIEITKPISLNSSDLIKPYYGLRYRHQFNTIPEVYFGAGYQPSTATLIHAAIGYGGYYPLHLRAGIQMFFSKYKLTIDSGALLNSITKPGIGKSVQLGFYAVF